MMAAQQEVRSFGWEFPDRLARPVGPRKGFDMDGRKVVSENIRLFIVTKRPNQEARPSRFFDDVPVYPFE